MPHLESLVELAHEVGSDLVVDHTIQTSTPILRGISDVDTRLARLRVVRHTGGCDLVGLEVDGQKLLKTERF